MKRSSSAFTVALIGPDGAGKSTISRHLQEESGLPVWTIYMGVNPDSSNVLLPSTRLVRSLKRALGIARDSGPRDPDAEEKSPRPSGGLRGAASAFRRSLGLVNRIAEEWYRQAAAVSLRRRGYIVLFDRHFVFDYHDDVERSRQPGKLPLSSRLHAALLERLYPKPDMVICLDAPGDVMFARKGEGSAALLERRRQEYLRMRPLVSHFFIIDATQPVEEVAREAAGLIEAFQARRAAGSRTPRPAEG